MNKYIWYCPNCKFIITNEEYIYARFDYECPRCEQKRFSEFHKKELHIPGYMGDINGLGCDPGVI